VISILCNNIGKYHNEQSGEGDLNNAWCEEGRAKQLPGRQTDGKILFSFFTDQIRVEFLFLCTAYVTLRFIIRHRTEN
jgi:hypothetical protein